MTFVFLKRVKNVTGRNLYSLWRSRWLSHFSINKDLQLKLKSDAQTIFKAALTAVSTQEMVKNNLTFHQNILSLKGREYTVNRNVSVVAFGKAVLGMAKATEDILRDNITRGMASVPVGLPDAIKVGNGDMRTVTTLHSQWTPGTPNLHLVGVLYPLYGHNACQIYWAVEVGWSNPLTLSYKKWSYYNDKEV